MNAFVDSLVRMSETCARQNGYVRHLVRTYSRAQNPCKRG